MEMSAAAKSKKIRDYALEMMRALLPMNPPQYALNLSWEIAEKMYEMEVETYDRIMQEAGYSAHTPKEGASAIAALRDSTTDASLKSASARTSGSQAK